jgi:cytochrome P450
VPRLLEKDYSYEGYHFPKNAVIHVLDVALARDNVLYPDPETFNPARWLNEEYPTFQGPTTSHPQLAGHHVFGRGRRMCPGQNMAQSELLVLCGNIIKNFVLSPKIDEKGEAIWPDPEHWTSDVIGGPLPFDCDIRVRSEEMKTNIESIYREAFN